MSTKKLQPLKGFRDRYPQDKALLEYIFKTVRSVATLYGFQEYDGPLVEPIELYEGKTSRELLEEQAFTLKDRNDNTLMLRPEMTPSLARMVAAKAQELSLPVRLFNIGRRFRYEAPQKGRDREFYQMDFDILGSDDQLADIELLSAVVEIYKQLGATEKDFVVYINSREVLNEALQALDISTATAKEVIYVIDRQEKVSAEKFTGMLEEVGLDQTQIDGVMSIISKPEEYAKNFADILLQVEAAGIQDFIEVNPTIVRGLDYYTGIVFEVKSKGQLGRSLLGGGRYDNLVGSFGTPEKIPGIGFALSDTVTIAFLEEMGLLPKIDVNPSKALVTVFSPDTQTASIEAVTQLRAAGIACELYPDTAKLPKQFKYADKKGIPFVIILGPDEVASQTAVLKDMTSGEQEIYMIDEIITKLS